MRRTFPAGILTVCPLSARLLKSWALTETKLRLRNFVRCANDFAIKYVTNQREQFKRLGVFGDWDNPYLTLKPEYEAKAD